MTSLKTIIVEDNPINYQRLKQLLTDHCEDVLVEGFAGTVEDAIKIIKKTNPGLVFLDIELPDGTGFDVLNFFKPLPFKVIFITGHQEYAYQAIKFHAADFLLKPVNISELVDAVKLITTTGIDDEYRNKIESVRHQLANQNKITLLGSNGFDIIEISEIIKLEADGQYTNIYLIGKKKMTYSRILKEFADLLSNHNNFIRTHRSFIVNLDHVKSFSLEGVIKLSEDHTAHLGDTYKEEFRSIFKK